MPMSANATFVKDYNNARIIVDSGKPVGRSSTPSPTFGFGLLTKCIAAAARLS